MRNEQIAFAVLDTPVPKPVGPRTRKSNGAWLRYARHKKAIGLAANRFFPVPYQAACALGCLFYLPCGTTKFSAMQLRQAASGSIVPTGKPDIKNLLAAVEDSLTGIAWADDSQVVLYPFMAKRYAVDQPARTYIVFRSLPMGLLNLPPAASLWPEDLRYD